MKIPDIKPVQISALLLEKQTSGLRIATIVKIYQILNQLFKKAYLEDVITFNPMTKVQRPKGNKS